MMSAMMSGLKFVAAKRPTALSPVQLRRNKLSNKLHEQILLAQALNEGKTYAPMRLRSVRDKQTGEVKRVEMPKRIRAWFFTADTGKVCLQVRYGSSTLDLGGKGKNSVEVNSPTELIKALEIIKTAVEAGELDAQLEAAGSKLKSGFRK
jgi:hypothetical protein